ncbi:hypothetical protein [Paenisporosarcina indica]|uniref:hypothetical protein n=1 Tax=Paenisporosarcina indica TaxID=650093 RepID=UPI00094F9464|nr:hypothetical protein [Paenisporosarcina indica]
MKKELIRIVVVGCLFLGAIFTISINTPEIKGNEQLGTEEIEPENQLLSFLQERIKEKLKNVDEVVEVTTYNNDSIIINTTIASSDTKKQLDISDRLFVELQKMNSQNGINRNINYTVVLKTVDEVVVGELMFGDHPLEN